MNINSPSSVKSPAKDFGINERILLGKDKVIAGFDRWQLAQNNGEQCISIINNLKNKARLSGGTPYPAELEPYCKKLEAIGSVFEDVIKSVAGFQKEIASSVSILETMLDNEELKERLSTVQRFLDVLIELFQSSLQVKQFVVGKFFFTSSFNCLHPNDLSTANIAHATSSHDSTILVASWSCDPNLKQMFKLVTQLKVSPPDHQWIVS